MKSDEECFRDWITYQIRFLFGQSELKSLLLLWLDPNREWLDLLRIAAENAKFELWANPEENELILRDRFQKAKRAPRVVWLPCRREDITWFKVFELEAGAVWEKRLFEALREYGVSIPREAESELVPLLPAYAREWCDKPKRTWKDLTPGSAKGSLVNNERMLEILAGESGQFARLKQEERFDIFARRAVEDFGFPNPKGMEGQKWRITTTARLLATDAAHGCPLNPPSEGENIIPAGIQRQNALSLLNIWLNHVQFIPSFESLSKEAEKALGLSYWARNLDAPPRSLSSRSVEETLFNLIADRLDRIEEVEILANELEKNQSVFQGRAGGFWSCLASNCVGWSYFLQLADAASVIAENSGAERNWQTAKDAVDWYSQRGWMLDQAGAALFTESPNLPKQLYRIRARMRRGYMRKVDELGRSFSELLAKGYEEILSLPTAGELALAELKRMKAPTALIFLDACSLHLAQSLAGLLNEGEPVKRAWVKTALAHLPTITAIGMTFALPIEREKINMECSADGKGFSIKAEGFSGNLAVVGERRKWLSENLGVKDFLSISDIFDSEKLRPAGKSRRLIAVEGDEFDSEGHEGQLKLMGPEEHLQRYSQAVRRLRDAGYVNVLITTDHGFIHWQPAEDEKEDPKPDGEILWLSRRAIVGRNLSHKSAIHFNIPNSDLEVMVPRSINAFKTYGGLGYFHGGATLQEMIIPFITINWPTKTTKMPVVLKPVGHIASETPRLQLEAGIKGQTGLFPDSAQLSRRALIKIRETSSGKLVFRHVDAVTIEPYGKAVTVQLQIMEPRPKVPYGSSLTVEVIDADNEELLAREEVIVKVDIDEW